MRYTSLTLSVVLLKFILLPSFSRYNTLYKLLETSRELTVLYFLLLTPTVFLLLSFLTVFGHVVLLLTYIAGPIPFPAFIYIYCIWVSPWTYLIGHTWPLISSTIVSCPLHNLLLFFSIWSFPITSTPRLCISPWAYHISLQHPFLSPTLPLVPV